LVTSTIFIFVQGNPFKKELPQYANSVGISLGSSTSDTGDIAKAALYGWEKFINPKFPKKTGVILLNLQTTGTATHSSLIMPHYATLKDNPIVKIH
jgi:hypothetical protein